jgi:hypothetical protein
MNDKTPTLQQNRNRPRRHTSGFADFWISKFSISGVRSKSEIGRGPLFITAQISTLEKERGIE